MVFQKNITNQRLLIGFAAVTVVSLLAAVAVQSPFPAAIPAALLLVYVTVVDFRSLFFLLLACIPISFEYQFPNGFGTDLPTEPLIVGLMLVYFLFVLKSGVILRGGEFLKHPFTLLIGISLAWAVLATMHSTDTFISIKFLLAKTWYIVTFYFLAAWLLRERRDFRQFIKAILIPLSIAVIVTTVRHAADGFSFLNVNYVMQPIFRNHVMYAAIVAVSLPFLVLAFCWARRGSTVKRLIFLGILLFLAAIQLSYTRAAYGAVVGAAAYYFVVRWRLTKLFVSICIVAVIGFVGYVTSHNKYLDYAPKFEKAISHQNFDNLLEATTKGEDVSTMERVYRWVAGFRMVGARPWAGFGPNTFPESYKSYTVVNFKTYVSDNKEGSTVHCYFLLMAIEQGVIGSLLFFLLVFVVLLRGEKIYHNSRPRSWQRHVTLAALLSFVTILILITINDLIETDKIGSFFFLNMAILANMDLKK